MGAVSAWDDHVRAGYAEGDKPRLIMPLIVEPKPGRPGKFRLIHDCRHLNKLLDKWPFKVENLTNFVKQCRSWTSSFRLTSKAHTIMSK